MNKIELKSKPRRAQGGKGLLSQTISVQESHKSISKISPREEKGGGRTEKRGATGEKEWRQAGKEAPSLLLPSSPF